MNIMLLHIIQAGSERLNKYKSDYIINYIEAI